MLTGVRSRLALLLFAGSTLALGLLAPSATSAPTARIAYAYDPPSWFEDGKRLIERRGGACKTRETTQQNPENAPGQTLVSQDENCTHRIPRKVAREFGQNPAVGEVCAGEAREVKPAAQPGGFFIEGYLYTCRVFSKPGTNAKPNRASWPCRRSKAADDGGGSKSDSRWTAEKTRVYRRQTFKTLRQCLSPRLRRKR